MTALLDFLNITSIEPHTNGFPVTTNTAYLVEGSALPHNDGAFNGRHATITGLQITNFRDSSASFSINAYSDFQLAGQPMFNKCRIPGHSTLVCLDKNMPISIVRDPNVQAINNSNRLMKSLYVSLDSGISGNHLHATVSYFTYDSA